MDHIYDICIIGGGINGCGIAADAAGRGLSVALCEQNDLASGTSSASTKLIHGGLRYLEHYEFSLVRKALKEREVLLKSAPHIIRPLKFLLPYHRGLRPAWLIRLGLFLYDHLGGRELLPGCKTVDLRDEKYRKILKPEFKKAFEYSDCRVDDARLVVLNAMRARDLGATILPRHQCIKAKREKDHWHIKIRNQKTDDSRTIKAKVLINAAGPWVDNVLSDILHKPDEKIMRLVKGSHIIVKRIYDHDNAYLFQGADGRIIFTIPYQGKFTLIGTTDQDYESNLSDVQISNAETEYLCQMASEYLKAEINVADVVDTYSGVRPLYNDGASEAQEATRDFVLKLDKGRNQAPLLNIIGGKITTYRVLAEKSLKKLKRYFPKMKEKWTAGKPLPGGNFNVTEYDYYEDKLQREYPFLKHHIIARLMSSYGTLAANVLKDAANIEEMGQHFGEGLYEKEVIYLIENEWAQTVDDILWRRTKLGLHLNKDQIGALIHWFAGKNTI